MARGSTAHGNLQEWLNKKRGGGRGTFLSKWKEGKTIRTWMHTQTMPCDVWRHNIPTLVSVNDKKTGEKKMRIFSKQYVCHETEETLEGQYWRDKATGEREHPIERCGVCKIVEWARQQSLLARATGGKKGIDWKTPMFEWKGVDEKGRPETKSVHIGGICNLFGAKDLRAEQKKELNDAGIYIGGDDGAWGENMYAKQQTIFCVVDDAHPEKGVQIAVETSLLGDKVKETINKVLKRSGPIKGNPQTHPYCIEWEYKKEEQVFNKKYDATDLPDVKPTPQILKLIRGEVPDTSEVRTPFKQQQVRAMLEAHCVLPAGKQPPWSELFPTAEQEEEWARQDAEAASEDASLREEIADRDAEPSANEESESEEAGDDDAVYDEDGIELVPCDNEKCGKPMRITDPKCPHCGKEYEVSAEPAEPPPPPPPPKPMRTRAAATAAAAKPKAAPAPAPSESSMPEDDEIPF